MMPLSKLRSDRLILVAEATGCNGPILLDVYVPCLLRRTHTVHAYYILFCKRFLKTLSYYTASQHGEPSQSGGMDKVTAK